MSAHVAPERRLLQDSNTSGIEGKADLLGAASAGRFWFLQWPRFDRHCGADATRDSATTAYFHDERASVASGLGTGAEVTAFAMLSPLTAVTADVLNPTAQTGNDRNPIFANRKKPRPGGFEDSSGRG